MTSNLEYSVTASLAGQLNLHAKEKKLARRTKILKNRTLNTCSIISALVTDVASFSSSRVRYLRHITGSSARKQCGVAVIDMLSSSNTTVDLELLTLEGRRNMEIAGLGHRYLGYRYNIPHELVSSSLHHSPINKT